jgi:predicted phage tail protein
VSGELQRGRYYARVRAANAVGLSPSSNEVQFRIGRRLATPGGFSVTWNGTVATLSWTAPVAATPADVPTGYVLEAGSAPGLSDAAIIPVGDVTTFQANVPTGVYYVRVRAVNDLGDSDPSSEVVVRAPGAPQAPTSLSASGAGANVDLQWTAPNGPPATGYVIEAGSAPGRADLAVLAVGNVTRFSTVAPPGVYYVRVRAVNARGPGDPSNEIIVRR